MSNVPKNDNLRDPVVRQMTGIIDVNAPYAALQH